LRDGLDRIHLLSIVVVRPANGRVGILALQLF
jgi:hypothetical protein